MFSLFDLVEDGPAEIDGGIGLPLSETAARLGRLTFHHADCREVLAATPDCSIDSCVTDPPYFLTSIVDRFGSSTSAPNQHGRDGAFSRLSRGFQGMRWDHPGSSEGISVFEAWLAGFIAGEGCFRIQSHKAGTYYTTTFSIRMRRDDAPVLLACRDRVGGRVQFRDAVTNSHGVSSNPSVQWVVDTRADCHALASILDRVPLFAKKANDYALWRRALHLWDTTPKGNRWGASRDVSEMASLHDRIRDVKRWPGEDAVDLDFDPFVHPAQAFHYGWAKAVYRVLKPGAHLIAFGGSKTSHRMVSAIEDAGFEIRDGLTWVYSTGFAKSHPTKGEGWVDFGTAAKPAFEPICLARKPFEGSVADNLAAFGVGALNIGACRVGPDRKHPPNVLTDGSPEALAATASYDGFPAFPLDVEDLDIDRIFYHAKARAHDRAKVGAGEGAIEHPTVKPVRLMEWLIRLITPPGGTVLEPFGGSGTTAQAALNDGFSCVMAEREAKYAEIIRQRFRGYL